MRDSPESARPTTDAERAVPHHVLIERLGQGWRASHAEVAKDFISRWKDHLSCDVAAKESADSHLGFTCDLSSIRLRGMESVPCLLVGGDGKGTKELTEEFWRGVGLDRTPVLIATSEASLSAARAALPPGRPLVIGPQAALRLLESPAPLACLKQELRSQIPRRNLIPFNIEHPAKGGMFCGRQKQMRCLRSESASFAVAGPARLGKTSLLLRFRQELVREGDPAAQSTFNITLYRCNRSSEGVAQFIALAIDGRKSNSEISTDRLENFFRYWSNHFRRPIDLLLDEVDEVLHLDVFDTLEMIARIGYCRLVLAGKSRLLNVMLDQKRALAGRLSLMRLDPLTPSETETLFLGPLEDLGLTIKDRQRVLQVVEDLTGRMPHHVQFYGRALSHAALDRGSDVDVAGLYEVRDAFETSAYFLGPLVSLPDPHSKSLAMALLNVPRQALTAPQVLSIAGTHGQILSIDEVWRICNDLVIETVLTWNRGLVEIANGTLIHHAKASGLVPASARPR